MNIFFLLEDISFNGGGERVVSLLSNYFCNIKNYKVTIITCREEHKSLNYDFKSKVINLNLTYSKHSKIGKINFWLKAINSLNNLLSNNEGVILGIGIEMNIVLSFLKNKKFKTIGCEHTCYNIQSNLMKLIRKCCYRYLNQIICLTNYDLSFYQKINKYSRVIYNPVIHSLKNNKEIKREKVICLVGRLSKEKQFDKFLYSIKDLIFSYQEWKIEIYGEGTERKNLEDLITKLNLEKNVKLMGNVKNIEEYLVKKSIFVLCSQYEGLPMVLLESLTCGLACISFNCETGPVEIIKNM